MCNDRKNRIPMTLIAGCFGMAATLSNAESAETTLDEVVVTAARMQEPLTVVTNPKAPRQPIPANDGADYLKNIPGFSVIRKGGTDGDPLFRGMAASRINLLLDGEQILGGCGMRMDPPTAYVFPETYDRVVVVKGPQTVLHGPGNSAATVLFERKRPKFDEKEFTGNASALGAANMGRVDLVGDALFGTGTFYGRADATRAEAGDYSDGSGAEVHSEYRRWSVNGAAGITPTKNSFFEFSAARSNGEAAYADRSMDGARFDRDNFGARYESEALSELVQKLQVQIYYNYIDHVMDNYTLRRFVPSMMMPNRSASNPDRRTTGGRFAVQLGETNQPNATLGVDVQRNLHSIRSTMNENAMPYESMARVRDAEFLSMGAFAELKFPFGDGQRIVTGARADRWTAEDRRTVIALNMGMMTPSNPTAGAERSATLPAGFVRWEMDARDIPITWYAGVGHVERFPDYWEAFSDKETATGLSAFNTRPEKTTQLDIGAVYSSDDLEFSISGFYNEVGDYILIQSGFQKGARLATIARNIDAHTYGAEADAVYAATQSLKFTGTLAYTNGTNSTDDIPLAQMPPFEARLAMSYERSRWSVGGLVRHVADQERFAVNQGNVVGQDLGPTDGFNVVSLNGSWRPSKTVLITAGVDNVFDELYAEHLSRSGAMVSGFAQTTRVNEPGRTAWLKTSAEFR